MHELHSLMRDCGILTEWKMLYNTRVLFAMNSNEAAFMVNFICSLGIQRGESGFFLELISGRSRRSVVIHGLLTKLNYLALNRWFVLYFAYVYRRH